MNVLVTGGAGYIGSHVVEELTANGYTPIVYDNFSTGHVDAVSDKVQLIEGDIHDFNFLKHILGEYEIDGVLHFAASSQVGESMVNPGKYYYNNVAGTLGLLDAMREAGVEQLVFSSTAAVYGEPDRVPITEDMPLQPTNVYGRTKLMIEKMMEDYSHAYGLRYVALRYFNAAGASLLGNIGEDHRPETHLIPPDHSGGPGPAGKCVHFRDGLSHSGRHLSPGLHPCEGSGQRPCTGHGPSPERRRLPDLQSGDGKRLLRPGNHRCGEDGHRPELYREGRGTAGRGSGETDRLFGKNQEGAPLGAPSQPDRGNRGNCLAVA